MRPYDISSRFGVTQPGVRDGVHTGIDLKMEMHTKLRSVTEGEVIQIFSGEGSIGKGVLVMGRDGREYIYGHMEKVSVRVGDFVEWGSFLGTSGSSGNSTGPHLHFGIRENGVYIDPTPYKPILDKISGDITPGDLPWWDVAGKAELAVKLEIEEMKAQFIAAGIEVLKDLGVMVVDLSYTIALFGGAIFLLAAAMGIRRGVKYFWALQLVNILIVSLLGGLLSGHGDSGS